MANATTLTYAQRAFMTAARNDDIRACEDLFKEAGSSANRLLSTKTALGWTPLHFAAANNSAFAVRFICNHSKAGQFPADIEGFRAFDIAQQHGYAQLAKIICSVDPEMIPDLKSSLTDASIQVKAKTRT